MRPPAFPEQGFGGVCAPKSLFGNTCGRVIAVKALEILTLLGGILQLRCCRCHGDDHGQHIRGIGGPRQSTWRGGRSAEAQADKHEAEEVEYGVGDDRYEQRAAALKDPREIHAENGGYDGHERL